MKTGLSTSGRDAHVKKSAVQVIYELAYIGSGVHISVSISRSIIPSFATNAIHLFHEHRPRLLAPTLHRNKEHIRIRPPVSRIVGLVGQSWRNISRCIQHTYRIDGIMQAIRRTRRMMYVMSCMHMHVSNHDHKLQQQHNCPSTGMRNIVAISATCTLWFCKVELLVASPLIAFTSHEKQFCKELSLKSSTRLYISEYHN